MPMTACLLTPILESDTVDLAAGLVFRKQILPEGNISYKGRLIPMGREYLTDLANAYAEHALDSVHFVVGADHEKDGMNAENVRGEVIGIDLAQGDEPPGLYANIRFDSAEAAKAVMATGGKLGVSARIQEGLARADGKTFKRAIVHVLGTLHPRVTGMAPWRQVDLAGYNDPDNTLDLSDKSYEELTVSDQQTDQITDDDLELTDEELQSIIDEAVAEYGDDNPGDQSGDDNNGGSTVADTDLSNGGGASTVDLAQNAMLQEANERANRALRQLAESNWKAERMTTFRAVPPAILDLATDLMAQPDPVVIDLGHGDDEQIDATDAMRKVLEAVAGYKLVDLGHELGHGGEFTDADKDADQATLDAWDTQYGH